MFLSCPQFLIYASYFAVIAVIFLLAGLNKWRRKRSGSAPVVLTGETDSTGDGCPAAADDKQDIGPSLDRLVPC